MTFICVCVRVSIDHLSSFVCSVLAVDHEKRKTTFEWALAATLMAVCEILFTAQLSVFFFSLIFVVLDEGNG